VKCESLCDIAVDKKNFPDITTVKQRLEMRLTTPAMPQARHLLSRPIRGIVCGSRFTSSLSSAAPPQATSAGQPRQNVHLPRTIASLLHPTSPEGQPDEDYVTIHGWVKSIRRMGRISFAHITDGTTTSPLQAVLSKPQAAG
jgi:lysyl-tRNA synthetase class II